ncbi:Hypothetical protein CINCED_3A024901 [Cinara cedri]|nr:Hypothetical protein CINCED_3A024901 [Cinara cedri]
MNAKEKKNTQSKIFDFGTPINNDSGFLKSILVGINETISQFTHINIESNPKFFEKDCIFVNIINSSDYNIVFRAYAPENFVYFRVLYNVTRDYENSFQNSTLTKVKNPEKSGAMFFFTDDLKFIIKTLNEQEVEVLSSMLSDYFSHFCEYPNTLLPTISGLYNLKYKSKNYYFIVMSNIYPYDLIYGIIQKYDLKGVNRRANEDINSKDKSMFRLLDQDFVKNYPGGLILPHNVYTDLKIIQKNDCELLKRFDIMDYSLLIVIEPFKYRMDKNNTDVNDINYTNYRKGIRATTYDNKDLLIYIGIIDTLQKYTLGRKIETLAVGILPCIGLSFEGCIVNPDDYMERYLQFITNIVFKSGK